MKIISPYFNINNNGINQSTIPKISQKDQKCCSTFSQLARDINGNAALVQAEYERDACEEELYRLRYGIENLLANKEHDIKIQQRNKFTDTRNQYNMTTTRNTSWIDRCSPCCRRWRKNRRNNHNSVSNEYSHRLNYKDEYYDNPSNEISKFRIPSEYHRLNIRS